jgi:hypothetical protein
MPRPDPAPPDPDAWWPSCDDQQPGVTIRPLSHADLAALLAHLDHDQDHQDQDLTAGPARMRPVVTVRVRAIVGRPGASAAAQYQRRRAAERAGWARTLPWRAAAMLAAGVAVGLLAAQVVARRGGLAGIAVAAGQAWVLRFRPSPDALAWRRGAAGERRTARLLARLERHGWAVLHDLAIPGSVANIDHLVVGPGGVVVIDSKQYRGRLHLDSYGLLWHGRHLLVSSLRKVRWQADQADQVLGIADINVGAIVAVHGASIPWGGLDADGVTVAPAGRVPDLLRALPPIRGALRAIDLSARPRSWRTFSPRRLRRQSEPGLVATQGGPAGPRPQVHRAGSGPVVGTGCVLRCVAGPRWPQPLLTAVAAAATATPPPAASSARPPPAARR